MNDKNILAQLGDDLPKLSAQAIDELNDLAVSFLRSAARQIAEREDARAKSKKIVTLDHNHGFLLPVANIPLPENGLNYFPCPITYPKKRHVSKCGTCEHFAGVFQRMFTDDPNDPDWLKATWSNKYGIRCKHVRELVGAQLEIE